MVNEFNIVLDLSYMPKGHTGHLVGSQETIDALTNIHERKPFKHVLEFGFNTGWSSALFLTLFPDVKMTSIEIIKETDSINGANILKETFPNRHQIIWGDSLDVAQQFYKNEIQKEEFDCAFIDGGHWPHIVESDIKLSKWLGIKNFIFDDGRHPNIKPAIQKDKDLVFQSSSSYRIVRWKNKVGYRWKANRTSNIDHYLIK
jgi:hypothetical protein